MKIQQTPNLQFNSQKADSKAQNASKSNVSFAGGESFVQFLKFLETNQAWGATAIDITCMGLPRTAVDFTRSPDAGAETMRREFSSTADDALVGSYGFVAALALAGALNKRYGVKAHKMFISDEMLNALSYTWDEKKSSKEPMKEYLGKVFGDVKGFNPEHAKSDVKGWVNLDKETQEKIVNRLASEAGDGKEEFTKETKAYLKSAMMTSVGTEHKFKLEKEINGKTQRAASSLGSFIDNLCKVTKSFANPKVAESFKSGNVANNDFIKGLKGMNKKASIIGLTVAAGIGICLQPINMYLTRKKTGKSGFVGVEGREPDKSNKFKLLKGVAAGIAGVAVLKNIGKFSEILSKVQFKGFTPTIPQYKLVYGLTIVSRLLSARDKNELRETSIKDSLGYASWLILGGFVSKLTAFGLENMSKFKNQGEKFVRYNKKENGTGFFNKLTRSNIISRDEVLYTEFKKAGISTLKADGKAMTFKEMLKIASKKPALKMAKSKIKYLNFVQFAGYLYSGVVLGVGIPKLNISITKAIEKKRKAKAERTKDQSQTIQAKRTEQKTETVKK